MDGDDFAREIAVLVSEMLDESVEIDAETVIQQGPMLTLHCRNGGIYEVTISCEQYPKWYRDAEDYAIAHEGEPR